MEYLEFTEHIRQCVQDKLSENETVSVREVLKNNGIRLKGLMITSGDQAVSPTIYLERFFDAYQNGTRVHTITDMIVKAYQENTLKDDSVLRFLDDYEKARKDLYLKAVNRERNAEMLQNVPHMDFLDLALVPYVLIQKIKKAKASVIIHNDILQYWHVSKKQIIADAMRNMIEHYGYKLIPMREILKDILRDTELVRVPETEEKMFVLLSPGMQYGAALMAVDTVMKKVADQLRSDFIILPSSIHELIVVPADIDKDQDELNELVKSVNETSVQEEDVLSDHAYCYKRVTGHVTA